MPIDESFKQEVENCPEIKLYLIIDAAGYLRWRLNHDMCDGRIPEADWPGCDEAIKEAFERQVIALGQLSRFGIKALGEDGKTPTDEYWQWFRKWDAYVKRTLSEEEWQELERKLQSGEDISMYKPQGASS